MSVYRVKGESLESVADAIRKKAGLEPTSRLSFPAEFSEAVENIEGHSANTVPEVLNSDAEDVDLDIADASGNVIARFSDGHIKTKEFDSRTTSSDIIKDTDSTADLDITDANGNVLARFVEGHVRTKNFDSETVNSPFEDYSETGLFTVGTALTLTINHAFQQGDEIYFHVDDGSNYNDWGKRASYYIDNAVFLSNQRGSNGYIRKVLESDCTSVKVVIAGDQYEANQNVTLHVYRIVGEIIPKIVTVKKDGSGMYTTLKAAVDSITDANHLTNPYVIEVYPGEYDTLEGFTDEEIASADSGGGYNENTFVGLKIKDGMTIRGIGIRDEIILKAELDPNTWTSGVRGIISTLNTTGTCALENLTIIGKHVRYCVHDDFRSPSNSLDLRVLKNLKFDGQDLAYKPFFTTYGAGMTNPRNYIIEDCDFGYTLGIHSVSGYKYGCSIVIKNCRGYRCAFGDYSNAENDAVNQITVINSDFDVLDLIRTDSTLQTDHMILDGFGGENSMICDTAMKPHRFGMIECAPVGIAVGKMVSIRSGALNEVEVTTNKDIARGIVIAADTDHSYIQKTGYIPSNYLGLTGLSLGDYVTVDNTGSIVTGSTAANAVGVVTAVQSSVAFIKVLF